MAGCYLVSCSPFCLDYCNLHKQFLFYHTELHPVSFLLFLKVFKICLNSSSELPCTASSECASGKVFWPQLFFPISVFNVSKSALQSEETLLSRVPELIIILWPASSRGVYFDLKGTSCFNISSAGVCWCNLTWFYCNQWSSASDSSLVLDGCQQKCRMTAFVFNLQTGLLQKDSSVVYLAFLISLSKCILYIFTTLAVYDKLALNILLQEYRRFVRRYTKPAQLQKTPKELTVLPSPAVGHSLLCCCRTDQLG